MLTSHIIVAQYQNQYWYNTLSLLRFHQSCMHSFVCVVCIVCVCVCVCVYVCVCIVLCNLVTGMALGSTSLALEAHHQAAAGSVRLASGAIPVKWASGESVCNKALLTRFFGVCLTKG